MSEIKLVEPAVYLVGRQDVTEGLDAFLSDLGVSWQSDGEQPAEILTEAAGRLCYLSFAKPRPGGNRAYLGHIKEVGHGSVLEHSVWNFIFTGVSRSLTHELVRHRAGMSYSQLSQRYVDESVAEYVAPPDLAEEIADGLALWTASWGKCDFGRDEYDCLTSPVPVHDGEEPLTEEEAIGIEWLNAVATAQRAYSKLSDYLTKKAVARGLERTEARKFARQAARSVLPNATETKIFVTMNGRAARHFLEQRGSKHAEPEIRKLANQLLEVLQKESGALFGDYMTEELPDGTFAISTPHPKV